ncbi:MAG: dihydropteroate synthase [Clostridium sp.]
MTQQDHGAHVLDVNVGLPEIDEPSMLEEVVRELQSASLTCRLQLDTTDPVAMERAMRVYNGKPLINSVNGKEEVHGARYLPLVPEVRRRCGERWRWMRAVSRRRQRAASRWRKRSIRRRLSTESDQKTSSLTRCA